MNILVSACLLGKPCRYDGTAKPNESVITFCKESGHTIFPVCPEVMGNLPIPHPPSEILGDRVISKLGDDVTAQFQKGAQAALALAKEKHCTLAILKANSPSCGSGTVYDGTFTGTLVSGWGIAARLLQENGVQVISEHDLGHFLETKLEQEWTKGEDADANLEQA